MSKAQDIFEEFRDSCAEDWAKAELGLEAIEPRKNNLRYTGVILGISTIILGAINTTEVIVVLAEWFSAGPNHRIGTIAGVFTVIVGGILTFLSPDQKSARYREALVQIGASRNELQLLLEGLQRRALVPDDRKARNAISVNIEKMLNTHDVPMAGREQRIAALLPQCPYYRKYEWKGDRVTDDSPTSEEPSETMTPIGQVS